MKRTIYVVGAAIRNERGDILCALRAPDMSLPNVWEFPGGKVEEGERPEDALVREIREELGCTISVGELLADVFHEYEHAIVHLRTYEARLVDGEPRAREHAELRWVPLQALRSLEWAPADIPTVEALLVEGAQKGVLDVLMRPRSIAD
ncbi:DNA mismatch repair protein MutT [Geobacillus thermocatenulatus]|uniref:8-oxo-dGTP diphosphatase n=1 Tax=Geobacillus thermocatenulatus TaxID=33938 RepID=A0A226Q6F1_9BACL|nr:MULTISPECIES: (deoxy)nucleoside triphosphate pyrophosphohydrolase [Geobacillus]AST00630.1 DNA mismatch repair protein MutT [Geobacillus thermocatenulatus]KLR75124.1 DNA mismatch repair protein MutT [Geobacillus sp. T6]OXB87012.1 DNA mismatch repair protein MutT [Geobacillus thermocatenulatus]RAN30482.1 DNA mismatch repair protein MutT [Geobacillus sp. A8]